MEYLNNKFYTFGSSSWTFKEDTEFIFSNVVLIDCVGRTSSLLIKPKSYDDPVLSSNIDCDCSEWLERGKLVSLGSNGSPYAGFWIELVDIRGGIVVEESSNEIDVSVSADECMLWSASRVYFCFCDDLFPVEGGFCFIEVDWIKIS